MTAAVSSDLLRAELEVLREKWVGAPTLTPRVVATVSGHMVQLGPFSKEKADRVRDLVREAEPDVLRVLSLVLSGRWTPAQPKAQRVIRPGFNMTAPAEGYGAWVRARRLELDLSQSALAYRTGLTQVRISQVETGKANPHDRLRRRLEKVLGTYAVKGNSDG